MTTLPYLHDATLQEFVLTWTDGTARLNFDNTINGTGIVTIKAISVTHVACPRLFPWGPSKFVNEVMLKALSDGFVLIVEMQSGDVLEISCKDISAA